MPTIIDSLIVQLGLDARNFTQGQRDVVAEHKQILRYLTDSYGKATQQVDDSLSRTVRSLTNLLGGLGSPMRLVHQSLTAIVQPSRQVQQNLNTVAQQGRRTGGAVQAGALAGASGLRVMAGAALIAMSAVVALAKVMESLKKTAAQTFNVGVGAAAAGMPVERFSAVSQALATHGPVPEEQTQAALSAIEQFHQQVLLGNPDPALMAAYGKLGLTGREGPEEVLRRLALLFSKERPEQAIAQAQTIGLSREMAMGLRNIGPRFDEYVKGQSGTAVTAHQVQVAREFNEALAKLGIQFEALDRELLEGLHSTLTKDIDTLIFFVKVLRSIVAVISGNWSNIPGIWGKSSDQGGVPEGVTSGNLEPLVQAILGKERSGPSSVSPKGAIGRFQIMPSTGAPYLKPGESLFDPAVNERVGRKIISDLWDKYHDAAAVMVAYNAGPQWADRWLASGRDSSILPDETRKYIAGIGTKAPTGPAAPPLSALPPLPSLGDALSGRAGTSKPYDVNGMLGQLRVGGALGSAGSVSNDNSRSVSVGDVHVHTQATSPAGIGDSVVDAINRSLLSGAVSTGLTP